MSFKLVNLLKNSRAFELPELVHSIVDAAVELHDGRNRSLAEGGGQVDSAVITNQQVSEIILFLVDSMRADSDRIPPSDLIRLVETVAYGAIQRTHSQGRERSEVGETVPPVYRLFAAVLLTPDHGSGYQQLKSRIQRECVEGLCHYTEEQRLLVDLASVENDDAKTASSRVFSIRDIAEILYYTLRTNGPWDADSSEYGHCAEDAWLEDCFVHLLDVLEFGEASTCSLVSGIVLPKLLGLSTDRLEVRLSVIWERLLKVHRASADSEPRQTANVFIALCGLSEFYIPVVTGRPSASPPGWLPDDGFWRVIRAGLVHTDPLARKQACFLMKRSIECASVNRVEIPDSALMISTRQDESSELRTQSLGAAALFWWSSECQDKLLAVWQDFFLMYETLDEVQVHVVIPVLPRMTSLIQAASTLHSNGRRILHPLWLTVLFSRCFVHETKTISKWGLLEYLRLDEASCPLLQDVGMEFLLGTVLPVLNEDSLYASRSQGGVDRPLIAEALTRFMQSCVQNLGKRGSEAFLREFLEAVSRQSWSPVSLTFVFDALTHLPECSAWGPSELQLLREMQFSCVGMLPLAYRSVVQCLMLQAVLRLLDREATGLRRLSGLLGLFDSCLRRASPLWTQVCEWFKASQHTAIFGSSGDMTPAVHSEVAALLTFDPRTLSTVAMDLADSGQPFRVARLVLLAVDTQYANAEGASSLPPSHPPDSESYMHSILAPLVTVLSSIGSHIYLPIVRAETALQLLQGILQHLLREELTDKGTDLVRQEMFSILSACLEEMYSFINRRLLSSEIAESADVSRVSLYVSVLESTHAFLEKSPRFALLGNVVASGRMRLTDCCRLLGTQSADNKQKNSQLGYFQAFIACRLLRWLLQMHPGSSDVHKLPLDTLSSLVSFEADALTPRGMPDASATPSLRKISTLLLCSKWQCVSFLLRQDRGSAGSAVPLPVGQTEDVVLAACVRDLTLVKGLDALPIMECAKALVNKIGPDTQSLCLGLVEAAWSASLDEWRGKAQKFWLVYSSAVELIFHHCFLLAEEGTAIHSALAKVICNILTLGEGKPKVVTVFAKHLCSQWAGQLDDEQARAPALKAVRNHLPLLMEICSMGSRVSKDIRLQQDIGVYLLQLRNLEAVKEDIVACVEQRSGQRRVVLVNFLLLIATTRSTECCQLITVFLQGLLNKFLELKTSTKRSYTMNTKLHRRNVRIWQMLLALVPYVAKDHVGPILDDVLTSLVRERQSSVQYLMIWVASQLLIRAPFLEERVWEHVHKLRETMENNVCPVFILIAHLGMVQPDQQRKELFYRRAFPAVLPWALVQTSSIRHLALRCVKKMWQDCAEAGLGSIRDAFPLLQSCMRFLQDGMSAVPSANKVDSYFFLFKVHPVQDYTVETIFHILPALCSLADDEFLEPEQFEKDCPSLWRRSVAARPAVCLYNGDKSLIQDEYRLTLAVQPSSSLASPGGSSTNAGPEIPDRESNVQKKIIPWQDTVMPGFDDVIGTTERDESRSRKGSLVLVASLIDKAPNLGGLCRTSQIFGVSTLVVNDLRVTTDKIFQTLSVTAEKWLPIVEVPVSDLAPYLQAMRDKGYTLVGVEQTARSRCLTKYQFPERTLLLLGHERSGIPAELIQLLDVCVEIPQLGIIRSLNVHVSGALLVWEYTRQRLLAQTAE